MSAASNSHHTTPEGNNAVFENLTEIHLESLHLYMGVQK